MTTPIDRELQREWPRRAEPIAISEHPGIWATPEVGGEMALAFGVDSHRVNPAGVA